MKKEIKELADFLGARWVGEVPRVAGGALGATHLSSIYQLRMMELHHNRYHDKAPASAQNSLPVSIDDRTSRALSLLANCASSPAAPLNDLQVAARILETATFQVLDQLVNDPIMSKQISDQQRAEGRLLLGDVQHANSKTSQLDS